VSGPHVDANLLCWQRAAVALLSRLCRRMSLKNCIIRELRYGFLFAFHSNYGFILYCFGVKARYLSKIAISFMPLAFDAPVRGAGGGGGGGFTSEYYHTVWYEKNQNGSATRRWQNFDDMFSCFDGIAACDCQTDRQSCHGIVRVMHTRRAVINGHVQFRAVILCHWFRDKLRL